MLLGASFLLLPTHAASTWSIQTVDKNAVRGGGVGITLDSHNNPHIAYNDYENGNYQNPMDLKYARWNGTGWNIQTVTQGGEYLDFVLDSNGTPHILYFDAATGYGLKYASWTGSNWNIQTIDDQGHKGSLALDSAGNPHIAYTANDNPIVLKYASWTGSSWSIQTLDSTGDFNYVSLALDSNNNPHIIYQTGNVTSGISSLIPSSAIKYAAWNASSGWNIQTALEGNVGFTHMALDSNGYPHFIYFEDNRNGNITFRTLMYDSWNGSAWKSQIVASNMDAAGSGGDFTIDSHDYPHIDYFNGTPDGGILMYARWISTAWDIQTVDSNNATSSGPIAVDSNGNPHITYSGPQPEWLTSYLMYATTTEPTQTTINIALLIAVPVLIVAVLVVLAYIRRKTRKRTKVNVTNKHRHSVFTLISYDGCAETKSAHRS